MSYVIYLVYAKYVVLSRYVLDVRLVLFREVRLCRKYILFGQLRLFCFDGNRGIYSQCSWEVWRASSKILDRGFQRSHELWNNAFYFLCSWNFCTYREVLLGEPSTRYSTQINALHSSIALYARI